MIVTYSSSRHIEFVLNPLQQIGAETAYGQQDYMLTMEGFEYPNPRRQFIEDFVEVIKELQNGLDEFIILMDANEQLGTNAQGLTYLMRECQLIDIFHQHHGVCPTFATYDLGNTRLDYAIGSASLLPFVNQCGFLPFYQGVSSDHRGMFIDLSMEIIDGLTHLEHIPRRHLNSAFQLDVYRYKKAVNKAFLSNDIFNKAETLFNRSGPIQQENTAFQDELESLDKLIVKIQLKAEQTCCTPRTKYDWSDEIHFHKVIVKYWAVQRKTKTKRRNVQAVTKEIYDSLPDTYRQYIDIETGKPLRNWERARRKLKRLKAQHRKHIEQIHVDSIANEAAFLGTTAEQVRIKRERTIRDKKLYTTLRQNFHPCTRSGISHLLVPDCDASGVPTDDVDLATTWRSETSPDVILERLLDRNIKHFGQAQGSPFTVPPLSSTFGFDGMSYEGQQLCQEGVVPTTTLNTHPVVQDVIHRLSDATYRHPTSHDLITFSAFESAVKKWRESTSTSPSGRHLGHYKSLIAIDSHSSAYTEEDPDPGQKLLQVLYHVSASAFQSGFTLSRWTNITTCMIEKIPGTPRLNKLRIIHLYEADYNLINKLVWQRGLVWQAHERGTLNPAQSGSRPYKTCIEVVLSKELKYLYSQLTRTSMGTMDNDAKSCYDRIVAAIALLISNQFGVPQEICQTVGATLQQMQFHLRTGMGDSTEFYTHTEDTPVHGVGQGGTASPAFWLLVSSALFDCHRAKASGMCMTDPSQTISLRQWLEAIVDDTSVFTNAGREPLLDDLVRTLEHDAQYWENLLSVSGGCLELSKCFYYVLAWTFTSQGDPRPLTTTEIAAHTAPVHIQELGKESSTPILMKAPEVAHKTLGVYKSITGNDKKHIQTLKERSENMASIVATSGLKPYQTEVAMRMIYTTAMGYSLPAVNLSAKVVNKIQAKALESFTPALGYNRTFPRAVLLGPTDFGGAGIPHLHTEAQIQKLEILLANVRADTDLGKLMCIDMNWIQLIIGRGEFFLSSNYDIPYIDNWFMGIREFLIQINARLEMPSIFTPALERTGDMYIMESFSNAVPKLSANQLRHLHNWRLYFQVNSLSDMCNAKGDKISPLYLTKPSPDTTSFVREDRQSNVLWPSQPPPSSLKTFQLWVRYIKKCYLDGNSKKLRQPLGVWNVSPSDSQSNWRTYYSISSKSLIVRQPTGLFLLNQVISTAPGTTTFAFTSEQIVTAIPIDYIPIDTTSLPDAYTVHHTSRLLGSSLLAVQHCIYPNDIVQTINSAPTWQRLLLQHFRIDDIDLLISSLINPDMKVYLVSDGGMKDRKGSFGVSAGTGSLELFSIEGPVSGYDEHSNSFRSEAYGMMAGLNFLSLLIKVYDIILPSSRKILVYCDNLSLVRRVQKLVAQQTYPRLFIRAESDAILQIAQAIRLLQTANFCIEVEHVKGHQDKDNVIPFHDLSRESQLNIAADEYATNFLQCGNIPPYEELPANPMSMYINDNVITRDLKTEIRKSSRSPDLRVYMLKKFKWKDSTPDKIWWSIHGSAIKSYNSSDRRRIRKFIFGWLPTSVRLKKYHLAINDTCPSCKTCSESHDHIITCNCASRITIKTTWLEKFDTFLSDTRYTPPEVRDIFIDHINEIMTPDSSISYEITTSKIRAAVLDQETIGWSHIFRGRLAYHWGGIIADHLALKKICEKEMTALVWGRKVTRYFHDFMLLLWKKRNEDGHYLTAQRESALTRERLLLRIEAFQTSNPSVAHHHRDFIYRPASILEAYTNSNLRSWFRAAENIVRLHKTKQRTSTNISDFGSQNTNNPNSNNPNSEPELLPIP